MVTCPNCKFIDVKVSDLNFAHKKGEGQPANRAVEVEEDFYCRSCSNGWDANPRSKELYQEYLGLREETEMIAQDMKPGGQYTVRYIDPIKLTRRHDLAKELASYHQHTLNISPSAWHDLKQDARL